MKKRFKKLFSRRNVTLGATICVFILGILILWISTFRVPTLETFTERRVSQSTKIYDKTGKILLYDVSQNIKRTLIPFDSISKNIKNATLAIEDVDFYSHNGVKPLSFLRAILVNLTTLKFSQGGSTITQQVIKNSLLTTDKLISRKIKEWVLAIKLEKVMTKDQIFNTYLNEIPYGGTIYGVEEASETFFGKPASDVTIAEAAYIAAVPKAPTYYSPYGKNTKDLDARKNLVLKEMQKNNFISQAEYEKAVAEKVVFLPKQDAGIKAPHFVMFVIDELQKKYGERVLEESGYKVITTLDYNLQKKGEELANKYALDNAKTFDAENIGLIAIDARTGGILTMVGSRNYFDKAIDGNFNITTAHRQPGSAFKPFAYATAFKKGYTPNTVLFDVPTEFSTECNPDGTPKTAGVNCYMPENYDQIFRGPTTMRNALAQSINVPSVKTFYLAGMKDTLQLAKDMGIQSLTNINQYGLTLVLGGGEVSLLDMTSAYGVFANEGVRNPYTAIQEITDRQGNIIEQYEANPKQVLDADIALKISDVLSDEDARMPAFGSHSPLYFPGRDVAVKTGTTNDYKDAWVIGYTPQIAVGAWAGNNNNRPMQKKVARFIIAPFWNDFMNQALKTVPDEKFKQPTIDNGFDLKPVLRGEWRGGISNLIDSVSNMRATELTPPETTKEIVTGGIHSILYWLKKDNPRSEEPAPSNPANDPQFNSWEYAIRKWVEKKHIIEPGTETLPSGYDTIHTTQNIPIVSITNMSNGQSIQSDTKVTVQTNAQGTYPLTNAQFFLNDTLLGNSSYPFTFTFIPKEIGVAPGNNTLRVVIIDSVFNKGETSIELNII